MNKKNVLKGVLDLFMVLMAALLYEKGVISIAFHEIAGLVLFGLFVIHIAVNHKWVTTVTKRIFDPKLPIKTKVGYMVNILLLICWVLIGVSGIFISKVIFNFHGSMIWKMIHFSASGFALILVGVHIGLHWNFVKGLLKKGFVWMKDAATPLGSTCLIIAILFGAYSVTTTSFTRWITMPFTSMTQAGGAMGEHPEGIGKGMPGDMPEGMQKDMPKGTNEGNGFGKQKGKEGMGKPDFAQRGEGEMPRNHEGQEMGMNRGFSFINVLRVICNYTSIMILFAAIAYAVEKLIQKTKQLKCAK